MMKIQAVELFRIPTGTSPVAATGAIRREVIQYGGQQFSCSAEMAQIFLKHAREVIESGEEQLVPLLHSGGIDLLLVSRLTPYSHFSSEDQ